MTEDPPFPAKNGMNGWSPPGGLESAAGGVLILRQFRYTLATPHGSK
jgi:hypothetical protein